MREICLITSTMIITKTIITAMAKYAKHAAIMVLQRVKHARWRALLVQHVDMITVTIMNVKLTGIEA